MAVGWVVRRKFGATATMKQTGNDVDHCCPLIDSVYGKYAGLRTERHDAGTSSSQHPEDTWLSMVSDVLSAYQPDLIWFDYPTLTLGRVEITPGVTSCACSAPVTPTLDGLNIQSHQLYDVN
jgi:hypothetical protein